MFGLMLNNSCGLHEETRDHYRLHHCGTCKAIGRQYGQSARVFLNFDCVFLAELLTAMSAEDTAAWEESFHSRLCFPAESKVEEAPLPLRYAAAANVLLSALKTDDNLKDSPSLFWRAVKGWFNAGFKKAETEMVRFGVDMDEIWQWVACQQQREKEKNIPADREEALRFFGEPTARMTAAVFSKGAALAGVAEKPMYDFGYELGELVYVLDALEDAEKDRRKKQFNALQRVYQTVDRSVRQAAGEYIFSLSRKTQESIQSLPIPAALKEEYKGRLSANLAMRVANALEEKWPWSENLKRSLWARLALRYQNARSFAKQVTRQKHTWVAAPQYAVSFLAVLVVPETAKEVHTAPGQGVAILAVMAAFFSGLFLWPKLRRLFTNYKKEFKRIRENRKGMPRRWKCWQLFLLALSAIAAALLILALGDCLGCEDETTQTCIEALCTGCCSAEC